MNHEWNPAGLRIALASYDLREIRVQKNYLQEQNAAICCCGFQSGRQLLEELRRSGGYDVIILGSQLEDMDGMQFLAQLRQLDCKPLLLLFDEGRHKNGASCLHPDGSCYIIKQTDLKDLMRELYRVPGLGAARIERMCTALYAEWGIQQPDVSCNYFTSALYIACGTDRKLAIRKEILQRVSEQYHVSVAAVDSGIRRMVEELEQQQTPGWCAFKRQNGFACEKLTTGKFIYAVKRHLFQETAGQT